jgi:hypothetical protein
MQYDERFWKTRLWLEILGGQKDELVKTSETPHQKSKNVKRSCAAQPSAVWS